MSLLIDLLIIALLAGVLAYAYLVDRRVRRLVTVLRELEPVVGKFSDAVDKSEDSVAAMKTVTQALETGIRRPAPAAEPAEKPETKTAEPGVVTFRSKRPTETAAKGIAQVSGKADLVRSFFDTARSREA
ncbi:MAG: flagellar motor switch protein [Pseudooceanicola sp.]|nr:flagellar motor switch protein [Pseudooceanicola sp.]|tara:strand:+ start:1984 stop:2373 length:390 start_codon:yes stop_codon:yes gene_type:complete